MPLFKTNFTIKKRFVETIDTTEHPCKELSKPLTPQQMLSRVSKGQPITVHKFSDNDIKFNGRFFNGDKLDVYDSIRLEQKRLKSRSAVDSLSSTAPADTSHGGSTQNTPQNMTDQTKQSGV